MVYGTFSLTGAPHNVLVPTFDDPDGKGLTLDH